MYAPLHFGSKDISSCAAAGRTLLTACAVIGLISVVHQPISWAVILTPLLKTRTMYSMAGCLSLCSASIIDILDSRAALQMKRNLLIAVAYSRPATLQLGDHVGL
jgi:hypothetical protein